ncbi:M61 family metallopeptidase [Flavobacterium psychrotolerans]|uniref:Peptidase M61 n=1 Tax=Flavobacterium psychrotolerans TaxID=2169410 RepID=A0A2U1JFW0_9FLAO|nr:peptidase M61 [Flavobacterium psychrotolerans]PWA03879.1 peptidase M61 [Flavobacterium psychrotolerans]
MKNIILAIVISWSSWSFKVISQTKPIEQVRVNIDLNTIKEDKVSVTIRPPKFSTKEVTYHIPKIIPGTYSEDDYGKFIDDLKAFDKKGVAIAVVKIDANSWKITDAKKVSKITYQVNDTFDTEIGDDFGKSDIFSPAGSNIDAGKNVLLNTHAFIGYFTNLNDSQYKINIAHPATLWGATSMTDLDASTTNDVFVTSRYAELVENPIMYAKPDYSTFNSNGMEILIAVYSPNGVHTAESITPDMKKMMIAQKNFLGKFNTTKKYSVLIYLSDVQKGNDAHGFGALEHPTATTVVMPEAMPLDQLTEQLKDVVSHEFFHIVTPLTIHSKEIQYFDYNTPKMSEHLWMYEGVTEYFANLFQVNQELISEEDFYGRIAGKITNAANMDDTMPFTKMSANVLTKPYKDQYLNVYEKGALIGMCLDIIIREKSNGERGLLDLMQKLSDVYGIKKPFNDEELFAKITELTYPEVNQFLTTYVSGETPIPYELYFAKVGLTKMKVKVLGNVFLKGQTPYITVNQTTKEIIVIPGIELNEFFTELKIKGNDIITSVNDTNYTLDNIYDMITTSESWKKDDPITVKIKRDGKEQILKGKTKLSYEDKEGYESTDASKNKLKETWLKG